MSNWIPTSERLPDKEGEYLVTQKTLRGNVVKISFIEDELGWYVYDDDLENYIKINVLAWQELPKPYEGKKYYIKHKWINEYNCLIFNKKQNEYQLCRGVFDTPNYQSSFTWAEIEEIKHKTGTDFNDKDWEIVEVEEDEKD